VLAAHHWVHDYACCHLQADCLESGISSGPLCTVTDKDTFTFKIKQSTKIEILGIVTAPLYLWTLWRYTNAVIIIIIGAMLTRELHGNGGGGNCGNPAVLPVNLAVIPRGRSCLLRGYRGNGTGY